MANKKITDLTLRSDFDETCNLPVDDTAQTWRTTGAQVLDFIVANLPAASAHVSLASNHTPASAGDPLIYDTVSYDPDTNYNVSTGEYTAPVDGTYSVKGAFSAGGTSNLQLAVNGTPVKYIGLTGSAFGVRSFATSVRLVATDVLTIVNDTGGVTFSGSAIPENHLSIDLIGF